MTDKVSYTVSNVHTNIKPGIKVYTYGCSTCYDLKASLDRQIDEAHSHAKANEALTTKLKECRLILRRHGLGHEYPGVDKSYEDNMERANSDSKAYYDLLAQYRFMQKENIKQSMWIQELNETHGTEFRWLLDIKDKYINLQKEHQKLIDKYVRIIKVVTLFRKIKYKFQAVFTRKKD